MRESRALKRTNSKIIFKHSFWENSSTEFRNRWLDYIVWWCDKSSSSQVANREMMLRLLYHCLFLIGVIVTKLFRRPFCGHNRIGFQFIKYSIHLTFHWYLKLITIHRPFWPYIYWMMGILVDPCTWSMIYTLTWRCPLLWPNYTNIASGPDHNRTAHCTRGLGSNFRVVHSSFTRPNFRPLLSEKLPGLSSFKLCRSRGSHSPFWEEQIWAQINLKHK